MCIIYIIYFIYVESLQSFLKEFISAAFGLGTMIYNGLEFGVFFEIPITSPCYQILRGVNPLLQLVFTFMQMYFIFMNARVGLILMCISFCIYTIYVHRVHTKHSRHEMQVCAWGQAGFGSIIHTDKHRTSHFGILKFLKSYTSFLKFFLAVRSGRQSRMLAFFFSYSIIKSCLQYSLQFFWRMSFYIEYIEYWRNGFLLNMNQHPYPILNPFTVTLL